MPMDGDSGIARDEADAIPPSDDALAAPGPGPSSAEEGDGGTTRDPEGNWEGAVATAQRMVAAMGDAMRGEFRLPKMEYQLLGRMNRLAADKYADMADFAAGLGVFVESLRGKERALAPLGKHIDGLESQIEALEAVVDRLDKYAARLETRVRAMY